MYVYELPYCLAAQRRKQKKKKKERKRKAWLEGKTHTRIQKCIYIYIYIYMQRSTRMRKLAGNRTTLLVEQGLCAPTIKRPLMHQHLKQTNTKQHEQQH